MGEEAGRSGGWRWLGEVGQVEVAMTASMLGRKELGHYGSHSPGDLGQGKCQAGVYDPVGQ